MQTFSGRLAKLTANYQPIYDLAVNPSIPIGIYVFPLIDPDSMDY